MTSDLEQLREKFLTDVDDETRADNEQKIKEYEKLILENESLLSWQEHEITRNLAQMAKDSYKHASLILAQRRDLTELERNKYWVMQDAALLILSLTEKDARGAIRQVQVEIKNALSVI